MAVCAARMPVLAIPHGGGPCFQLPDGSVGPRGMWLAMGSYLKQLSKSLPAKPKALLIVSSHWEAEVPSLLTSPAPPLLYDYSGFPPAAYSIKWPAPGATGLADRVAELLSAAGIASAKDDSRGFDHGTFVPLQVAFPAADVPTTQLSLLRSLSPAAHVAMGRALAPLRDEGVLIVGSGMTFHNMQGLMSLMGGGSGAAAVRERSDAFDAWLSETLGVGAAAADVTPEERLQRLQRWADAPNARYCHPREEHLLPVLVAAAAAGGAPAERPYTEALGGGARVSAFEWR